MGPRFFHIVAPSPPGVSEPLHEPVPICSVTPACRPRGAAQPWLCPPSIVQTHIGHMALCPLCTFICPHQGKRWWVFMLPAQAWALINWKLHLWNNEIVVKAWNRQTSMRSTEPSILREVRLPSHQTAGFAAHPSYKASERVSLWRWLQKQENHGGYSEWTLVWLWKKNKFWILRSTF